MLSPAPRRPLLTEREVAVLLNVSVKVLQKWRAQGIGPPWTRVGPTAIRYWPEKLDQWLSARASAPDERIHLPSMRRVA